MGTNFEEQKQNYNNALNKVDEAIQEQQHWILIDKKKL